MAKLVMVALIVIGLAVIFIGVFGPTEEGGGPSGGGPAGGGEGSGALSDLDAPGESAGDDGEGEVSSPEQVTVPDQPGGGVPVGEVDIRVEEGRTNGQRQFAGGFVEAVYGYAGSDQTEYRSRVEDYVDPRTFYESAGAGAVEEMAGRVSEQGTPGAASLVGYTISYGPAVGSEVPASEVEAFAGTVSPQTLSGASLAETSYAVGEGYDGSGEVSGDVRYYAQELLVVSRSGDSGPWLVLAASAPEPIEDPNAGAPAPSEPKVGEPSGPGG